MKQSQVLNVFTEWGNSHSFWKDGLKNQNKNGFFKMLSVSLTSYAELTHQSISIKGIKLQLLFAGSAK